MASIYLKCGSSITSFVIHSVSSSSYPLTVTSKSPQLYPGFASSSTDAYIDTVVPTSARARVYSYSSYDNLVNGTNWTSRWWLADDKYISTSSGTRYIEVRNEGTYYYYMYRWLTTDGTTVGNSGTMVGTSTVGGVSVTLSTIPTYTGYTKTGGYAATRGCVIYQQEDRAFCMSTDINTPSIIGVYVKKNLTAFYWFDNEQTDANNIQTGNQRVMTASMWDSFADTVDVLASVCGVSVSISRPSSGSAMNASQYNSAVTALSTIKASKTVFRNVTLPSSLSSGDSIAASQFQGTSSIKGALNAMINLL